MNISTLMLTGIFIYYTALIDSNHISDGQHFKDHKPRFLQRATVFAIIFIYNWKIGVASSLMFISLFDITLNILMKVPPLYLGNTAKWDRFFRKRMWLYILMKIGALITSIYLFFNA